MSEELALAEILEEKDPLPAVLVHDRIAAGLMPLIGEADGSRRFSCTLADPYSWVVDMVARNTGRTVGQNATWVRYLDPQNGRGLLAVAQPGYINSEADLVLAAQPGMLTRNILRDLCWWLFNALGFQRVVVRLQPSEAHLADYLRRAGFLHEGTAYDFFGYGAHAAVWAMTVHRCRWLSPPKLAIPTADTSPPSSHARH